MTHACHAQYVAVDDIVNALIVLYVAKALAKSDQHANVVDQNADLQLVQFISQSVVDFLAFGEVYGDRFHLDRAVLTFYKRT